MNEPATTRRRSVWPLLLLVVAAWFALRAVLWPASPPAVVCERDHAVDADTVVMLSASWCGYCARARRWLQAEGIAHCEYDVETTAEGRRRFAALTQRVVPVFQLRSDVLVGFNRTEIEQTLIAHGLAEFDD